MNRVSTFALQVPDYDGKGYSKVVLQSRNRYKPNNLADGVQQDGSEKNRGNTHSSYHFDKTDKKITPKK